jgi:hypothetical protein
VNDASVAFIQDEGFLSVTGTNIDVSLPLDPNYDRGTFVGAKGSGNGNTSVQTLALSETGNTFAAYLLTRDEGATSQSYIGRTVELDSLPTGQATLTGTYVGSFHEDSDRLRAYITGDAIVNVDFDEMTISGRIENRTADLFDLGLEFTLNDEIAVIELPETSIDRNGLFSGDSVSDSVVAADGSFLTEASTMTETINYSGLIGGASVDSPEVVGTIQVLRTSTDPDNFRIPETETGVFAIGH